MTPEGEEPPPNANKRERLHGLRLGHTLDHLEEERISMIGNLFYCVVVAYLLATWAKSVEHLEAIPFPV